MQNVYTHDEIVAFVDQHLKRMGTNSRHDKKIANEVVGWISQLPPLFQVLTIESRHSIVFADPGVMNRLYWGLDQSQGSILGFYLGAAKKLDNIELDHPIFFHRESRGGAMGSITAAHEKAHDFDLMLATWRAKTTSGRFYSNISKSWEAALERQIGLLCEKTDFANEDPAELLRWGKQKLSSVFAAQTKSPNLYDDYRPLLSHLSLYDTKEKRLAETTAEMGAHYATLYAQTGGDEASIDIKLTARYREVWAEYRDSIIPQYKEMAEDLLKVREENIRRYVTAAKNMTNEFGISVVDEQLAEVAAIAHAGGYIEEAIEDVNKLAAFYKNPIDNYCAALEGRDALLSQYDSRYVPKLDGAGQGDDALSTYRTYELKALGEAYLDIEREKACFQTFIEAYDGLMNAIDKDGGAVRYFSLIYPEQTAVSTFRNIYGKGEGAAIRDHLAWIPLPEQATAFKDATLQLLKLRLTILAQPIDEERVTQKARQDIVSDMQAIIEGGRYNDVLARTAALTEEVAALSSYNKKIVALAQKISTHTGEQGLRPTGQEILERFDAIKAKSGIDGVQQATEMLKISSDAIKGYVAVRKNHYDWEQSIIKYGVAFVPHSVHGSNVILTGRDQTISAQILSAISEEVMQFGLSGGADAMEGRKKELQDHIKVMQKQVIHTPEAQERRLTEFLARGISEVLKGFNL